MAQLTPVITDAGLAAAFSASNAGLAAEITHVALGAGAYAPNPARTGLAQERMRVPVAGGRRLSGAQIHVTALADGPQSFWIREVGFYLADGTLFAVWSDAKQPLAWKEANVQLLLAFDLALSAIPAGSITIAPGGQNLNLHLAGEMAELAAAQIETMTRQIQLEQRLRNGGL